MAPQSDTAPSQVASSSNMDPSLAAAMPPTAVVAAAAAAAVLPGTEKAANVRKGRFEIRELPAGKEGKETGQAGGAVSVAEMRVQNLETGEMDHVIQGGKLVPSGSEKSLDGGSSSDGDQQSLQQKQQQHAPVYNLNTLNAPTASRKVSFGAICPQGNQSAISAGAVGAGGPAHPPIPQDSVSVLIQQNQMIMERLAALELSASGSALQVTTSSNLTVPSPTAAGLAPRGIIGDGSKVAAAATSALSNPQGQLQSQQQTAPFHARPGLARAATTGSNMTSLSGAPAQRNELARFSMILEQLRVEAELGNSRRKEMELELKTVREKNKTLEERIKAEQTKSAGLEQKLERSKTRNRSLQEDLNAAIALLPPGALAGRPKIATAGEQAAPKPEQAPAAAGAGAKAVDANATTLSPPRWANFPQSNSSVADGGSNTPNNLTAAAVGSGSHGRTWSTGSSSTVGTLGSLGHQLSPDECGSVVDSPNRQRSGSSASTSGVSSVGISAPQVSQEYQTDSLASGTPAGVGMLPKTASLPSGSLSYAGASTSSGAQQHRRSSSCTMVGNSGAQHFKASPSTGSGGSGADVQAAIMMQYNYAHQSPTTSNASNATSSPGVWSQATS